MCSKSYLCVQKWSWQISLKFKCSRLFPNSKDKHPAHWSLVWDIPITWRDLRVKTDNAWRWFDVRGQSGSLMVPRPRAEQSLPCHLHCFALLKQHSAFNRFRGSCALPTSLLMFNSSPDARGTLVTTTTKKKRRQKGKEGEWKGRKMLELNVCSAFAIGKCVMNEGPKTRPRKLEASERKRRLRGQINLISLLWLASGCRWGRRGCCWTPWRARS